MMSSYDKIVKRGTDEERNRIINLVEKCNCCDKCKEIITNLVQAGVTAEQISAVNSAVSSFGNGSNFMDLVDQYQKQTGCSKTDAMKHVMKTNPAAHGAYLESVNQ